MDTEYRKNRFGGYCRNLLRTRQFYETYREYEKVSAPPTQLTWTQKLHEFYERAQGQAALPALEEKKAAKPRKGRKK